MKHPYIITLLAVIALSLSSIHINAQEANSAWEEANSAYQEGQYEEAIIGYENTLISTPTAQVYYNLGNAYFKTGEIAHAILNYERSLRLDPQNEQAAFNLEFAQTRIIDNIEDHSQFFLLKWGQALRNSMRESTWLVVSVVFFLLCLVGIFLFAFMRTTWVRKTAFYTAVVALVLSLVGMWCGLSLHHRDNAREEAIVMQGIVNAKASPDKSGTDLFVLHEGTKVRITDLVGEWCEVEVGGNIGWVKQAAVERI